MTAAMVHEETSDIVRPFASRVVRQEWAGRVVVPMVDAADRVARPRGAGFPAAAYEESPRALFVYRMRSGSDEYVGVVADVRLDAFANGKVRGHESVEPDRVEALVRHYTEVPARSELVALLHARPPTATRHIAEACRGRPLLHIAGPDGLEHTVWRVAVQKETAALAAALGHGIQYIADGHHRVAARLRVWEREGRPAGSGVLCVLFPMEGLRLSAFHRRVTGPVDAAPLLDAASVDFVVREVPGAQESTGVGLYVAGRWYDLGYRQTRPDGSAGLDAAVLQTHVLDRVLGISGPGHPRLEVVPARVALEDLTSRCDEDGGALFVLRPPPLQKLIEVADRGEVTPPKTTYFAPKPYAGIFLT